MRSIAFVLLVCSLGNSLADAQVSDPRPELAELRDRKELGEIGRVLGRLGRPDPIAEIRRVLRNLGAPDAELRDFDKKTRKALKLARRRRGVPKAIVDRLRQVAAKLASRLPKLGEDERADLAFEIVALDASNAAAQKALDHSLVDGVWRDAEGHARSKRVAEIRAAVRRAMDFDPKFEVVETTHPLHKQLGHGKSLELRLGKLKIFSTLPRERSTTIVRNAMRAHALGEWLVSNKFEVRCAREDCTWVIIESAEDYEKAVVEAVKGGHLDSAHVEDAKHWVCFHDSRGWTTVDHTSDSYAQRTLVSQFVGRRDLVPFIRAGLCNWVCETVLGQPAIDIVVFETESQGKTASKVVRKTKRVAAETYRKAGSYGRREWMKWLVETGTSPGLVSLFVDQAGRLRGKELTKCTLLVEYWIELGPMLQLVADLSRGEDKSGPAFVPFFVGATGSKLEDFEADWREWLLGTPPSLVDRLARKEPSAKESARARDALRYLSKIRHRAYAGEHMQEYYEVESLEPKSTPLFDPALSAKALQLAEHLDKAGSIEQSEAVLAELDSMKPSGAWRLAAGLVDLTSTGPKASIDRWMGSALHRANLLDPALVGIGWAESRDVVVCDASSLMGGSVGYWAITWPAHKASDIPRTHARVDMLPVVKKKATQLGYPISLHLSYAVARGKGFDVKLELRAGTSGGKKVDCWFSTPSKPLNRQAVPRRTWYLVPKAPLEPNTTYHVRGTILGPEVYNLRWFFKTRAK